MDALILAAGFGSRIRDVEPCKPLTKLHGISLLEIAVRQLAGVGITRVIVATGYLAEEVEAALPEIADRAGVVVEPKQVPDFELPNGRSVLAGAADFGGDFLLVMADHVFSSDALRPLMADGLTNDGAILAIDRSVISPLIDPDDATWVQTDEDGTIQQIGKTIATYNAVDCGAFRASPALLAAIRDTIADGQPGSLSDGMQRLADLGQASTVDIGDAWWIDVDDAHALSMANAEVRGQLPELFA